MAAKRTITEGFTGCCLTLILVTLFVTGTLMAIVMAGALLLAAPQLILAAPILLFAILILLVIIGVITKTIELTLKLLSPKKIKPEDPMTP